ncbi:MAG: GNAT family N-acetyltransferase [Pacificimonas sp.]|jgi:GNAT superfamily N-acetyltransferase|nr:GNAT family N-acetyltransferase [Pacificimonas sp.]
MTRCPLPEGYAIRSATVADIEALDPIRTAAFRPVFASFRRLVGDEIAPYAFDGAEEEQGDYFRKTLDADDPHRCAVAETDGELAGFVCWTIKDGGEMGILAFMFVAPAHQGFGLGAALTDYACDAMRDAGAKAVEVGTGNDESHGPARAAYRRAGFTREVPSVYLYKKL